MSKTRLLLILLASALVFAGCSAAVPLPRQKAVYDLAQFEPLHPQAVPGTPRYVLAIIDSAEGRAPDQNEIHTFAEFILNYLGYGVIYLDISKQPLPLLEEMGRYAGILTWFQDQKMPDPRAYIGWLEKNVAAGRRYITMGNLGTFRDSNTGEVLTAAEATRPLQLLGARFLGNDTDNPLLIEVARKVPELIEYERPLSPPLFYEQVKSVDPANQIWLTMNNKALQDGLSDLVFISPRGAYVHPGYVWWQDPQTFKRQLRIDLFTFFERALGQGLRPIPDVTTLNGGRVLYSQIDGDGFRSTYEPDPSIIAAEKIEADLLKAYPYLFTAGVIVDDVSGSFFGGPRMQRVARDIFALDNVEIASHGWFHPFGWRGKLLELPEGLPPNFLETNQTRETTLDREIPNSIKYINSTLAPPGKSVRVFLWSGEANPMGDALDATDEAGVSNMNGGLGRFDASFDSVSYLAPLIAQPEGRIQYYATNANDNNYSGLWQGPFEGLKDILVTFERTDSPRRLTSMDVYLHFFSGTKIASLSAIYQVFDWMKTQDVTSVWVSDYVASVQGFFKTEIVSAGDGRWIISNYDHMRTVRFDNPNLVVDLDRSRNVVGYRRINDSLYVFLGEGDSAAVAVSQSAVSASHLSYCGCMVSSLKAAIGQDTYSIEARVPTQFVVSGLKPLARISYDIAGSEAMKGKATADTSGDARFPIPKGARTVTIQGTGS